MKIKLDLNNIFRSAGALQQAKVQAIGKMGEYTFDWVAKKYLSDEFKLLSDVVLKSGSGTAQIDQVIVSPYGIFVVEIKTYRGCIFGSNGDRWIQAFYNRENTFVLQSLLKFSDADKKNGFVR